MKFLELAGMPRSWLVQNSADIRLRIKLKDSRTYLLALKDLYAKALKCLMLYVGAQVGLQGLALALPVALPNRVRQHS